MRCSSRGVRGRRLLHRAWRGRRVLLTPFLLIRYPETPPEYVATAGLLIVAVSSGVNAAQCDADRRPGRTGLGTPDRRGRAVFHRRCGTDSVHSKSGSLPSRLQALCWLLPRSCWHRNHSGSPHSPTRVAQVAVQDRRGDNYVYTFPPISALVAAGAVSCRAWPVSAVGRCIRPSKSA